MSLDARNVTSSILKDGDRVFIARTYFPDGTRPRGFTPETLKRCASTVTLGMDQILSNLPDGSSLILEARPLKNWKEEKTPSASDPRKKKS